MEGIFTHALVRDQDLAERLHRDGGFEVTESNGLYVVSRQIALPRDASKESIDDVTNRVRADTHYLTLARMDAEDGFLDIPGVLVGSQTRGRLSENGEPTGYIAEITQDGPIIHSLADADFSVPVLAGYGSLLDPYQLAANTAPGDLRNTKDSALRERLAKEKDVLNKMAYVQMDGLTLVFNRAPTAGRYGDTQQERNQNTVLNLREDSRAKAYMMLFDPATLTDDPRVYFVIENADEAEYNRLRIDAGKIHRIAGAETDVGSHVWALYSPLITDVDGKLGTITVTPESRIHERYVDMITNGLAGAEKTAPGFALNYLQNTLQADGTPLLENAAVIDALAAKLAA